MTAALHLTAGATRQNTLYEGWVPSLFGARRYDVVIVGGRAAGASTALLLARAGARVLVIERSSYGSDTLSTHALMPTGVEHLQRWGLIDQVSATAPAVGRTVFEFAQRSVSVDLGINDDVTRLYAPRRTELDKILVDAAQQAGAEFVFNARVVGLGKASDGRVEHVDFEAQHGIRWTVPADLVVGADGLRSFVARQVDAPVIRESDHFLASIYTYIRGADLPDDDYLFSYGNGAIAGSVPTSGGLHCIVVSLDPSQFRTTARADLFALYERTLQNVSPRLATAARAGAVVGPLRSFPGHRGQFRRAHGPGWALVGDAGYFIDPAVAHGMSDALRDAELLATAIVDDNLPRYQQARDEVSLPLFNEVDRLTSLTWDDEEIACIMWNIVSSMGRGQQALKRQGHRLPMIGALAG